MRSYPTLYISVKNGQFQYDRFQETGLTVGEAVIIYHYSTDKEWCFVQAENYIGWIQSENVAKCTADEFMKYYRSDKYMLCIAERMEIDGTVLRMGDKVPYKSVDENGFIALMPKKCNDPANDETKGLVNSKLFSEMKDGVILLNFSRDVLVNDKDLKEAIASGKVRKYVTDFANANVVKYENTICLPHLGASTEEAEDNCALMAINQLKDYIENGNITNSVNYPTTNAGIKGDDIRICINHHNVPGMIAKFSTVLSEENINIANLVNKSKGDYAYTIIDVDKKADVAAIKSIDGVLRVREL